MPCGHPGHDPDGKSMPPAGVTHMCPAGIAPVPKGAASYGLRLMEDEAITRPLEAHTGFEPARSAWKADMLPLHQCAMLVRPGFPGDGLPRTDRLGKKDKEVVWVWHPWRAEQDSDLLPPVVHTGVLPKAPPARIAATMGGKKPNHLGFLRFSGSRT